MTFSWLHVITVKCEEIQIGAGLEKKNVNPSMSFRQAALTFCLPGVTTCLS